MSLSYENTARVHVPISGKGHTCGAGKPQKLWLKINRTLDDTSVGIYVHSQEDFF